LRPERDALGATDTYAAYIETLSPDKPPSGGTVRRGQTQTRACYPEVSLSIVVDREAYGMSARGHQDAPTYVYWVP